jgi:hypothetical protein
MCFGGGKTQVVPAPPPPPTDTPSPPGREANQRFQQIRAGLAGSGGEATVIDPSKAAKSATVIG